MSDDIQYSLDRYDSKDKMIKRNELNNASNFISSIISNQSYDENSDQSSEETLDEIVHTKSNHHEPHILSVPYSRFDDRAKFMLVVQCAFTGFYSAIAGAIYYPVLTVIQDKFHITEEQANITVVVYFLFQGLAPSIMGGLADSLGRRPVVICSIMVYFCACIGLACSQDYAQIIALRCLQAAGISPVIAINSGIMGDITTKAERGGYVGYVAGFQIIGSALGALIGALLANRWNWRSIFWFLTIGSGVCGILSFIILPETKRTIAGNGSIQPKLIVNRAPILHIPYVRRQLHLDDPDMDTLEPNIPVNFLAPLSVLRIIDMDILLLVAGLQFSLWTVHQTALTTVLSKKYHLTVLQIGLCYLPTGICTLISVVTSGRYLNWIYRKQFTKHKKWLEAEKTKLLLENDNDLIKVQEIMKSDPHYTFNLFAARLRPAFGTIIISSSGFIAFGWCISVKAPLAAVLIMSGFASLFSNCILTFSTTLIVDLFPSKASTATGCLNLFRCLLSAIFIACLSKMVSTMTYGGVFSFLGVLNILSSFLLFVLIKHGKRIVFSRRQEEERLLEESKKSKNDEKV